ncbi:MAG: alpha/beta fold hydrolase [Dehalococcoidia bacterium]
MGLISELPHSVEVTGRAVEYYVLGTGPPLVLLHGLGGSADVWYRVAPVLAEHFTVFAPQLWGTGPAARQGTYTIEDGVSFVTGFMDAVECTSAHLCGSSLGGLIAGFTAVRHPARVRSLTLAASAGLGREAAFFLRAMTLPLAGEVIFRPSRRRIQRLVRTLVPDHAAIDDRLVEALYQDRLRPGVPRQMLNVLRSGISSLGTKRHVLLSPYLHEIEAPALVLWGEEDPLFPVKHGTHAARAIPNARLHVFPGAGHWPYIERPSEFIEIMRAFLVHSEGLAAS